MLKAVVDTSVFVSGYLSRTGTSASSEIIARWRAGEFKLVMSRQILEEIVAKFVARGIDEARILEFVETVGKLALNIPGAYVVYRLDDVDPDDNMLLAAAQEGGAEYLVSRDEQHVLPLKHHHETQIVSPQLFLRVLRAELAASNVADDVDETEEERHERLFQEELQAVRAEKADAEAHQGDT